MLFPTLARILRGGSCAALIAAGLPALAVPLDYSSWSQVYGYVNTSYSSPYLGNISFSINGPSDYRFWQPGSPSPVASASFTIAPNQPAGVDTVYDLVTNYGAYGFSYSGQSQVTGTQVHAQIATTQVDADLNPVSWTSNSYIYAYSTASWSQQMLIAPTSGRPAGSYGAILVGITLDGPTPTSDSWGYADMNTASSFTDLAGVSYSSSFTIEVDANDPGWSGVKTVYKKLLFQYGTPFTLTTSLVTASMGNGSADFMNTGKISYLELPFGATLQSGAEDAGLGSLAALYGTVLNSATPEDANTNWDFGNNGGGFQAPVPEPSVILLFAAGLGVIGWKLRRGLKPFSA